jgi:hypothetical protein
MKRTSFKPFRAFITNQYYENRDEYESAGQRQPYTFEEYVAKNILNLKTKYRLTTRTKDRIV